jgi:hypothetical protein
MSLKNKRIDTEHDDERTCIAGLHENEQVANNHVACWWCIHACMQMIGNRITIAQE